MACCGKGRRRVYAGSETQISRPRPPVSRPVRRRPVSAAVYFEYEGRTGMTVIGSVSGRRYRFAASGSVLAVDGRDGPGIAAVPGLRRVAPSSR